MLWPRPRSARADEHPVRRQGRRSLRPGGQPPRLADRSVRLQGDRAEPGPGRGPGHGRQVARGARITTEPIPRYVSVKEAVFPFVKFPGVDIVLGPEMRSTGEVMGIDSDFASAFAKSQLAALSRLPSRGTVFVSVAERSPGRCANSRRLATLGFRLTRHQRDCRDAPRARHSITTSARSAKAAQSARPSRRRYHRSDRQYTQRQGARTDEGRIRAGAVSHGVPCITTIAGARAAVAAMERLREGRLNVYALQDLLSNVGARLAAPILPKVPAG